MQTRERGRAQLGGAKHRELRCDRGRETREDTSRNRSSWDSFRSRRAAERSLSCRHCHSMQAASRGSTRAAAATYTCQGVGTYSKRASADPVVTPSAWPARMPPRCYLLDLEPLGWAAPLFRERTPRRMRVLYTPMGHSSGIYNICC